ncbi:MerR family transcriptional regulator [Kitasatospora acidiphila]|uniref:MerR family transcriptional regulator n=1 Tax=Kitasatospora acidiphila TaxID=2567942 RepID=A0A540W9G3_9ACTN|nr:MerR family transcriptional regulator [Kitasatospora acidiphila]TQF05622.1 MerR family transcriptional regulator [Kitasatospora acidiphila]
MSAELLASLDDAERTPRHSISEVAELTGLTAHTLRWYERIGLLEPVDRTHAGRRRYSDADLARLEFLGKLRLTGMSVADMVRYIEMVREGPATMDARRDLLIEHRAEVRERIADLHASLAVLDYKIDFYGAQAATTANTIAQANTSAKTTATVTTNDSTTTHERTTTNNSNSRKAVSA